jgi:hypothetical protein
MGYMVGALLLSSFSSPHHMGMGMEMGMEMGMGMGVGARD